MNAAIEFFAPHHDDCTCDSDPEHCKAEEHDDIGQIDRAIAAAKEHLSSLKPRLMMSMWTAEQRAAKAVIDELEAKREALAAPILAERRQQDADRFAMDIAAGGDGEGC